MRRLRRQQSPSADGCRSRAGALNHGRQSRRQPIARRALTPAPLHVWQGIGHQQNGGLGE